MHAALRSRIPVDRVKTLARRPPFTFDGFLDRITTPRAPEKANDLFVLGVFGSTCLGVLITSAALMARHFGL